MKCEYCGTDNKNDERCTACGAKLPEKAADVWKSEPFFYNGYICYTLRKPETDTLEVQFWLGRELIERIAVTRDLLEYHVPQGYDMMPFFWDLFLVAQGEQEVLTYKEKNNRYPATFEIRRIENPDKVRWWGMSLHDIVQESR